MQTDEAIHTIEVTAARLAIEWKHLFATELKLAAIKLAHGSLRLTSEHYRQAAPIALAKVLEAVNSPTDSASNAQRRVA